MKQEAYIFRLDDGICAELFQTMLSLVSREKRSRINLFRFEIDKVLSVCAEVIVRYLICKNLLFRNCEIIFGNNLYGKPYLKNDTAFHLNVSHTKSAVCVVISVQPVGIDIEKIQCCNMQIAQRFFTKQECLYIDAFDSDRRFYEVWTKKEAYIKCIGKGLSIPLNSFDVLDPSLHDRIKTAYQSGYAVSICGDGINSFAKLADLSTQEVSDMTMYLSSN